MQMRLDPTPLDVLGVRRRKVAARLDGGAMVLSSPAVRHSSRDTEYPYRPDSELFWLTGIREPGAVAVLTGGDEPRLTLFVRPKDPVAETWSGVRPGPEGSQAMSGADQVFSLDEMGEHLPSLLDAAPRLWYRLTEDGPAEEHVLAALKRARERGARTGSGPRGVSDPGSILDELRLIKDAWELAQMREAIRITQEGFRALAGALRPGVGEWVLEAELEGAFRREGGDGPAYESIVGSGANGCVLHYVSNDAVVETGSLVLVDAGSACGLYAGDITRTFPADGSFTPLQRSVYEVVDAAREAGVEAVRPGAPVGDVHAAAVEVIVGGLVELGVLTGEVSELVEAGACRPFFPHQTSHWLGLDVHDVGDYAVDGSPRELAPGMVLTVEPGLYFGDALVDAVLGKTEGPSEGPMAEGIAAAREALAPGGADALNRLRGIGVRVEDDVLVTRDGHENLTAALPTEVAAVERLVQDGKQT